MEGGAVEATPGRAKRKGTAQQTAESMAAEKRKREAGEERKRKRGVRVRYVAEQTRGAATGEALARLMEVGTALMDRVSDGREWRDGSHRAKRMRRTERRGDG